MNEIEQNEEIPTNFRQENTNLNRILNESLIDIRNSNDSSLLQTMMIQTPLPWKIMTILCICILSEPVSMTILFPFFYFMVNMIV